MLFKQNISVKKSKSKKNEMRTAKKDEVEKVKSSLKKKMRTRKKKMEKP